MTSSSTDLGAPPTARDAGLARLAGWVEQIPDRVLVLAMCALLATTIPVQLNQFHPYTVFPLFVVLAAATWRMTPGRYLPARAVRTFAGARPASGTGARGGSRFAGDSRTPWVCTVVAVVIVLLWIWVQRPYFSELLSVRRDPAIYTLRGLWLMNHPSPDVTFTQQLLDIQRAVPQVGLDFGAETGRLTRYFQSTTVVPGMIAVAGWIGGASLLLQADILIGAAALLCLYAVGRRMAGPVIGLVPMVALALCMPMSAFSRVAYTEPLSMIAVLACLMGLWQAVLTRRPAMWLLAGWGAGGVAICRIDGWVVVVGAFVGIGIWGAFASSRQVRREVLRGYLWFLLAVIPVGALGATDLIFHSPDYLAVLKPTWKPLAEAVPAVAVLCGLVIVTPGIRQLAGWFAVHRKLVSRIAVGGVGLLMVLVIARPLFFHAHFIVDAATQAGVAARQKAEGLPIDPSRSYDDQSVTWIAWYLGWPAVIMACLAGLWAIAVAIRRRSTAIVLVMSVVAVNAGLYLFTVSITPDQIWAMRRFLPVILPGGLLILGWGLRELYERRERIGARLMPGLEVHARPRVVSFVIGVLAVVVAFFPATAWGPMFPVKEGVGQYDLVEKVCSRIENQKVLIVGNIPVMGYYQPTFRNLCNSTVITVPASDAVTQQAQIKKVLSLWGAGPVQVVSFYSANVPWTKDPGPANLSDTYRMWESVLSHRPRKAVTETTQIWLGTAQPNGQVIPG